jgi:hypothetical protein
MISLAETFRPLNFKTNLPIFDTILFSINPSQRRGKTTDFQRQTLASLNKIDYRGKPTQDGMD